MHIKQRVWIFALSVAFDEYNFGKSLLVTQMVLQTDVHLFENKTVNELE